MEDLRLRFGKKKEEDLRFGGKERIGGLEERKAGSARSTRGSADFHWEISCARPKALTSFFFLRKIRFARPKAVHQFV